MQSQQPNPFFLFFEKRRLKVVELHRSRREEMFNRSRQMLYNQFDSLSLDNSSQSMNPTGSNNQEEGCSSSVNASSEIDAIFNVKVEQSQVSSLTMLENEQDKSQLQLPKTVKKNSVSKNKKLRKYAKNYAKILQIPSWMNTVPEELNKFYAAARPSGKSGLLVIQGGWIYIYDKYGRQISISNFSGATNENQSQLKKIAQHFEGTILEIVYCEVSCTIFVNDLIKWKLTIMSAQNFEFRYAWLLANIGQLFNSKLVNLKIRLVQYFLLENVQNLQKVYQQNFGYEKEGLLFVQKDSPYVHGYNENAMIWKDYHTSKYPIDQPQPLLQKEHESPSLYIYGMGKLSKSGNIYSLEGYKLGHINPAIMPGVIGGFIRYRLTSITFNTEKKKEMEMEIEGEDELSNQLKIQLANFEIIQYKRYGRAEPLSRLIFQYRMRHDPLPIQLIAKGIPN